MTSDERGLLAAPLTEAIGERREAGRRPAPLSPF